MEIKLAKTAGFCFGVKRAVDIAFECGEKYHKIYSLGPVIHNKNVIEELAQHGVDVVDNIESIPDETNVLIRAHGVAKNVITRLEMKKCNIIDATCPFVSKIHKIVDKESIDGRKIVIIGKADHPEVLEIGRASCRERVLRLV